MASKLGAIVKAIAELDAAGLTESLPAPDAGGTATIADLLDTIATIVRSSASSLIDGPQTLNQQLNGGRWPLAAADLLSSASLLTQNVCASWFLPLVERLLVDDLKSWAAAKCPSLTQFLAASHVADDDGRRLLLSASELGWLGPGPGFTCAAGALAPVNLGWLDRALHRACGRAIRKCVHFCANADALPSAWLEAAQKLSSRPAAEAALEAGSPAGLAIQNLRRLASGASASLMREGGEGGADGAAAAEHVDVDVDADVAMTDVDSASSLPLFGLAWTWAATVLLPWAASRLQPLAGPPPCQLALRRSIRALAVSVSSSITAAVLGSLAAPASAFALLRDWPDSAPAIRDLALAIRCAPASARPLERVAAALRAALSARLLQAGAATATLLQFLLDAQRALAALDPSNCLAPVLTGAIGGYLRARPDALRLIVAALRGPGASGAADGEDAAAEAPSELHSDLMHGSAGASGGGEGSSGGQSFDAALPKLAAELCGLPAPSAEALLRLRHTLAERAGVVASAAAASASARGGAAGGLDAAAAAASAVGSVPIALAQLPGGKEVPATAADAVGFAEAAAGAGGALGGAEPPAPRFDPFAHAAEGRDAHALGNGHGHGGSAARSGAGSGLPAPDASSATALGLLSAVHPAAAALRGHGASGGSGAVSGVTATVAPGVDDAAGGLTHDDDGIGSELGEGEEAGSDDDDDNPDDSGFSTGILGGPGVADGRRTASATAAAGACCENCGSSGSSGSSGGAHSKRSRIVMLPWRRSQLKGIPLSLRPLIAASLLPTSGADHIGVDADADASHESGAGAGDAAGADEGGRRTSVLLWEAVGAGLSSVRPGIRNEVAAAAGALTAAEAGAAARSGQRLLGFWQPAPIAAGPLAASGPHYFPRLIAALTSTTAGSSTSAGDADSSSSSVGAGAVFSPLSLVLSLYGGSPAPLLAEHRLQTALALLALPAGDFDVAGHEQQRELLAARLGEGEATAALADVGIMLRDATDSKRISRDVAEAQAAARRKLVDEGSAAEREADGDGDAPAADVLVVSHYFWPDLPEERLQVHPALQGVFDAAAHTYAVKRKPRHLVLQPSQGLVNLTVTVVGEGEDGSVAEREMDVPCSLPQASFLLFALDALRGAEERDAEGSGGDGGAVPLADVAAAVGMSQAISRQVASFWAGVRALRLCASPAGLMLAPPAADASAAEVEAVAGRPGAAAGPGDEAADDSDRDDDDDDDDDGDTAATAGGGRAHGATGAGAHASSAFDVDEAEAGAGGSSGGDPPEAVALWRQFVNGMLTNLGPLPLDRIHVNLKMFAGMGPFPYDKDLGELRALLAGMEADGEIVQQPGQVYAPA